MRMEEYLIGFTNVSCFLSETLKGARLVFSGRWLAPEKGQEKDQPKYLNSPETELFNKRQVLFNLDKARSDIRKSGEVLLFEGFMDVIASWQAGVKNGIASMGTSLTNQQIQQIERVTKELVFVTMEIRQDSRQRIEGSNCYDKIVDCNYQSL